MPTPEDHASPGGRRRWRTAARLIEAGLFVALLLVDFEIGARRAVVDDDFLAGAIVTAGVAVIVAVLALARGWLLPTAVAVPSVIGLSVAASLVSAVIGSPAFSLTESLAVGVATAAGVRSATGRWSIAAAASAVVAALAMVVVRVGVDLTAVLLAVLAWGVAVTVGAAGRAARVRRESAMEAARRAERLELARELHDVVAHQVTGIVVQAQAAIAVARTDPDRVADSLNAIEAAGAEALAGMRRMVGTIRDDAGRTPPVSVAYGLDDLAPLVERFDAGRARTTLHIDVEHSLPPGVAESAYRVVREALTNVRKHAPDAVTRVDLRVVGEELRVEVVNDAAHSAPARATGFGLTGMVERVEALGGSVRAGSDEPGTWSVRVRLPLGVPR